MPGILRWTLIFWLFSAMSMGAWAADQGSPSDDAPNHDSVARLQQTPLKGSSQDIRSDLDRLPAPLARSRRYPARDTVCYTMRSYLMVRDNRDSESTWQAGYSTCQPASQYELRFSNQPAPSSSR